MKINFLILLMLATLFFNNCPTTHNMELTVVASPDQKTDPYGAVVSEKKHMISISHYKEIDYMHDNAIFNIIIENRGEDPLTISNENISVIFEEHDKKRTVKKLKVLSAKEFMQDLEYGYRNREIMGLSMVLRSGSAENRFLKIGEVRREEEILRETLPKLILEQETIMPRNIIGVLISCRTNKIPRGINGDFKINA